MRKIEHFVGMGLLSLLGFCTHAQGQADSNGASEPKELNLYVAYGNSNNQVQYVKATAKTKINGRFSLVPGVALQFYIKEDSPQYLLGKAVTDHKGEAMVYLTPGARAVWLASPKQRFLVVSDGGMGFPVTKADVEMTKAKLQVDTAAGRSVLVRLVEQSENGWKPVKGVDVRVAVKRMDGNLNIADASTYTTDSSGSFAADYKLDSLPGDSHGNITLVASVDDNDSYGSISAEKVVPWGVYHPWVSDYNQRTLYARRGRSPFWLNFMAYSIILLVWGAIVYLLFQFGKIRALG